MKLFDVCVMYWDGSKEYHKGTPHYNLPYALAKSKKLAIESSPNYPKGTFVKLPPNGTNPLNYKPKKMITLYDTDVFPGGIHKGETVESVCQKDPNYIRSFNNLPTWTQQWKKNIVISDETMRSLSHVTK